MAVRDIDYRTSGYNLASAGEEMRKEKWSKQRVKDYCRSRGLDKEQTEIVLGGHKKSNEDRVDALVKDCDKLAARMDALNKRADACFNPKRADAGSDYDSFMKAILAEKNAGRRPDELFDILTKVGNELVLVKNVPGQHTTEAITKAVKYLQMSGSRPSNAWNAKYTHNASPKSDKKYREGNYKTVRYRGD